MISVHDALPGFYAELASALDKAGQQGLLEQLPRLVITRRCGCNEYGCASFDVQPSRELNIVEARVIGLRHGGSISLEVDGMVVVDTDNFDRVSSIEILDRPDVAKALKKAGVPTRSASPGSLA